MTQLYYGRGFLENLHIDVVRVATSDSLYMFPAMTKILKSSSPRNGVEKFTIVTAQLDSLQLESLISVITVCKIFPSRTTEVLKYELCLY